MTTQESLAALIEAAPPELREVLRGPCAECYDKPIDPIADGTHPNFQRDVYDQGYLCPGCMQYQVRVGKGRITLPVPEATLAAQEWVISRTQGLVALATDDVEVFWEPRGVNGQGPDIFSAIRAALEAK